MFNHRLDESKRPFVWRTALLTVTIVSLVLATVAATATWGPSRVTLRATATDKWAHPSPAPRSTPPPSVAARSTAPPPPPNPTPRGGSAVVYDAQDGYLLAFGGFLANGHALGDTWKFQNGSWTDLTPQLKQSPSARGYASIAYDAADGYVVLFGGRQTQSAGAVYGDTWTFSGGTWSNVTSNLSTAPSPRFDAALTFDSADNYTLLFGGHTATGVVNDTWTFHAGAWSNLTASLSTAPSIRHASAMAYDPADGEVVLFGGYYAGTYYHDTWTFSGGAWTHLYPASSPSARYGSGFAYDAKDGYLLLSGGCSALVCGLSDTWTFHGGAWTHRFPSPAPGAHYDPGMVYDAKHGYVVLGPACGVGWGCPSSTPTTWAYSGGVWVRYL